MKKSFLNLFAFASIACLSGTISLMAQSVNTIIDKPVNGTFTLNPPLPADGKYPSGTIVTVTATPAPGMFLMPDITLNRADGDKCILNQ